MYVFSDVLYMHTKFFIVILFLVVLQQVSRFLDLLRS